MSGGYGSLFNQSQALPTNLQNYVGGQGAPALMNQDAQQGATANPFTGANPYAFMGRMGRNFGRPTDFNAMTQSMMGSGGAGPFNTMAQSMAGLLPASAFGSTGGTLTGATPVQLPVDEETFEWTPSESQGAR